MKVELIYDHDCPNVSAGRAQLERAFARAGIAPKWREWERSAPESPGYVRGYGSPTILVNGKDVEGIHPSDGGSSCRIYRGASGKLQAAPSVETIAAALRVAASQRTGWRGLLATMPGVGAALLPVGACPACWPAYAGVLSSAGLGFLFQRAWLLPLTVAFLGLALLALAYGAGSRRGYSPLALGLIGAASAVGFKFFVGFPPLFYLGLALLIGASVWNSWPVQPQSQGSCPTCASAGAVSLETKHTNQKKG